MSPIGKFELLGWSFSLLVNIQPKGTYMAFAYSISCQSQGPNREEHLNYDLEINYCEFGVNPMHLRRDFPFFSERKFWRKVG